MLRSSKRNQFIGGVSTLALGAGAIAVLAAASPGKEPGSCAQIAECAYAADLIGYDPGTNRAAQSFEVKSDTSTTKVYNFSADELSVSAVTRAIGYYEKHYREPRQASELVLPATGHAIVLPVISKLRASNTHYVLDVAPDTAMPRHEATSGATLFPAQQKNTTVTVVRRPGETATGIGTALSSLYTETCQGIVAVDTRRLVEPIDTKLAQDTRCISDGTAMQAAAEGESYYDYKRAMETLQNPSVKYGKTVYSLLLDMVPQDTYQSMARVMAGQ